MKMPLSDALQSSSEQAESRPRYRIFDQKQGQKDALLEENKH